MFCPNCGKEAADGAKFCGNCGAKFPEKKIEKPEEMKKEDSSPAKPQKKISGKVVAVIAAVVVFGVLVKTVSGHIGGKKADIPDQEELAVEEENNQVKDAEEAVVADVENTEDTEEPKLANVRDIEFDQLTGRVDIRYDSRYWQAYGVETATQKEHVMLIDKDGSIIQDFTPVDQDTAGGDYDFLKDDVLTYEDGANNPNSIKIVALDGRDITSEYVPDGEEIIWAGETDIGYRIVTYREEDAFEGHLDYISFYDDCKNLIYSCERSALEQEYMDITGKEGTMDWDKQIHSWGFIKYCSKGLFIIDSGFYNAAIFSEEQKAYKFEGDVYSDGINLLDGLSVFNKETREFNGIDIGIVPDYEKFVDEGLLYFSNVDKEDENGDSYEASEIIDLEGNVVIDLDYNQRRLYDMSSFYDGYALIIMTNDAGSAFGMIIDEEGNWMFEDPIPIEKDMYVYCPENKCFIVEQRENDEVTLLPIYTNGTIGTGVKIKGRIGAHSFVENDGVYFYTFDYDTKVFSSVKIE